jgi:hypothetical protein
MPRLTDYPRKSLAQSLELAAAVDSLGGTSSEEMAGSKLGRKGTNSGAFAALVGAAVKFGLLDNRKATLSVTSRYRDYKLAYDEEQRTQALRAAFLNPPLFRAITERFSGKAIPTDILDKLLIREFGVPEALAARVGEYFLEGAKAVRLLSDAGVLIADGGPSSVATPAPAVSEAVETVPISPEPVLVPTSHYVVRVTGPGISSSVDIIDEEDLVLVDALLKRIRRSLKTTS